MLRQTYRFYFLLGHPLKRTLFFGEMSLVEVDGCLDTTPGCLVHVDDSLGDSSRDRLPTQVVVVAVCEAVHFFQRVQSQTGNLGRRFETKVVGQLRKSKRVRFDELAPVAAGGAATQTSSIQHGDGFRSRSRVFQQSFGDTETRDA